VQRIARREIHLERFGPSHARQLLELRTEALARTLELPTGIYPFEESDILTLCEGNPTPREFLQACLNGFEHWLFDEPDLPQLDATANSPRSSTIALESEGHSLVEILESELRLQEDQSRDRGGRLVPNEENFFGELNELLRLILEEVNPRYGRAELGNRVMPFNLVIQAGSDSSVCLAILNAQGVSLTSRLGNLLEVGRQQRVFRHLVLLRDARCPVPASSTVGAQRLRDIQDQGHEYILVDLAELAWLEAMYRVMISIEQGDLTIGRTPISRQQYAAFLRTSGALRRSQVFRSLARHNVLLANAISVLEPNEAPPQLVG
jgi:hypothetical protein